MKFFILLFFLFFLAMPDIANAGYLDPGAGSSLMQVIAAFLAGVSRFFRKLFGRQ